MKKIKNNDLKTGHYFFTGKFYFMLKSVKFCSIVYIVLKITFFQGEHTMYRKILSLILCGLLLTFVGCNKSQNVDNSNNDESKPQVAKVYINPLTGEQGEQFKDSAQKRPVAIMVNNISIAQKVQTGLAKADIVYETEVEGGITRLMAVFQDISKVEKIGTVRSARYAYVDLSMGHNAVYVHHGQDPVYCKPHLKDTQTLILGTNNAGVRIRNGLSSEHTLYGYGEKIWNVLVDRGYDLELKDAKNWQNFADAKTSVKFENIATTINVPFSSAYKSVFKYDTESGKYIRFFKDVERKDYNTGESEYFKNIFVLVTKIVDYPDGKHRKIDLTQGHGYYCVNGTYVPIKWVKGAASDSFVFTNTDGTPLTVSQGNSWVCIKGDVLKATFE